MGQRLRELRERAGFSLREVAKAAKVSAPFLSDVELGRRFPTNETLALIAQKLRASADEPEEARPPLVPWRTSNVLRKAAPASVLPCVRSSTQVHSGKLTPDELAAKLRRVSKTK